MPSSLATIEACDKIPPCSTTIPWDKAISAVQPGSVRLVTKISKLSGSGIVNSLRTIARPVAWPGETPIPFFSFWLFTSTMVGHWPFCTLKYAGGSSDLKNSYSFWQ